VVSEAVTVKSKPLESAAPPSRLRTVVLLCLFLLPSVVAFSWSSLPAIQTVIAAITLHVESTEGAFGSDVDLRVRRSVQQHFLGYNTYIPLDDILILSDDSSAPERLPFLVRRACGNGKLFVWVPLTFRIPLLGYRVFEWCMKPKMK